MCSASSSFNLLASGCIKDIGYGMGILWYGYIIVEVEFTDGGQTSNVTSIDHNNYNNITPLFCTFGNDNHLSMLDISQFIERWWWPC